MLAAKSSVLLDYGVMYFSTAFDFHLPICLMSLRGMPAAIAEFVAPLLKECPEYVAGL